MTHRYAALSKRLENAGLTLVLAIAATVGIVFPVSLAFGVDLIFGTIFIFIAIAYLPVISAIFVAIICGVSTWYLWGHPYSAAVFILEAGFVFCLHRRVNRSLLFSDSIFWLFLGVPLTLFYLNRLMGLSLESAQLIAFKQLVNAIFNVLIASLSVLLVDILRGKYSSFYLGKKQIKDILFHSMVALTLIAGALPIIQSGKTDEINTKQRLKVSLSTPLNYLVTDLERSSYPVQDVLTAFASRPRIEPEFSYAILDVNGEVIASAGEPWVRELNTLLEGELEFINPKEDLSLLQSLRRGRYQMFQTVDREQPLSVLVQANAAPFAEKTATDTFQLLTLLGFLLVVGIILSHLLSRFLTGPIWRLSAALDSSTNGIVITNLVGRVEWINKGFTRITGYSLDKVKGKLVDVFLYDSDTKENMIENNRINTDAEHSHILRASGIADVLNHTNEWQGERTIHNKVGKPVYLDLRVSLVSSEQDKTSGYIFLISDITELKDYQNKLERMAHYDALTGLPNRVLLGERLDHAMRVVEREEKQLAVLFIDLDGFKSVNDELGHEGGDKLLQIITSRINAELREKDTFARFGGDEFIIVLPDISEIEAVDNIVKRVLQTVEGKINIAKQEISITASIGITFYTHRETLDAEQLLRQADHAMYEAKQRGRNSYQYFDNDTDKAVRMFHEVISMVGSALESNQLVLFYQPKVNLKSGEVIGAEALIRWQHPERGLVPPSEFLPMIEQDKLSIEVGEWVLNTALSQMATWRKQGLHLPVSVNINSLHLMEGDLARRLKEILQQYPSVDPRDLELEVVETSALDNLEMVSQLINDCRRLGVSFSLDDFGTGYSSLSYLRLLPVERLKIDLSFVRDMLVDQNDFAIVKGILDLASSFNLGVIAEGVETTAHSAKLLEIGCGFGQGYGIAKPMPGEQVINWIAHWNSEHLVG